MRIMSGHPYGKGIHLNHVTPPAVTPIDEENNSMTFRILRLVANFFAVALSRVLE